MGYALLPMAFSLTHSGAEQALEACEILILVFGLILAIGAAGEHLEEHGTLPGWMKWSSQPTRVFIWMVALSLVGELVADAGVFVFSGQLQTISDGEYAALNEKAGVAMERAAAADLARVKLEEQLAWRTLKSAQLNELCVALKPFAGQTYGVTLQADNPEENGLAGDLESALQCAGWTRAGREGPLSAAADGLRFRGFAIDVNPAAPDGVKAAAAAMGSKLAPWLAISPVSPLGTVMKAERIRIVIGRKP